MSATLRKGGKDVMAINRLKSGGRIQQRTRRPLARQVTPQSLMGLSSSSSEPVGSEDTPKEGCGGFFGSIRSFFQRDSHLRMAASFADLERDDAERMGMLAAASHLLNTAPASTYLQQRRGSEHAKARRMAGDVHNIRS